VVDLVSDRGSNPRASIKSPRLRETCAEARVFSFSPSLAFQLTSAALIRPDGFLTRVDDDLPPSCDGSNWYAAAHPPDGETNGTTRAPTRFTNETQVTPQPPSVFSRPRRLRRGSGLQRQRDADRTKNTVASDRECPPKRPTFKKSPEHARRLPCSAANFGWRLCRPIFRCRPTEECHLDHRWHGLVRIPRLGASCRGAGDDGRVQLPRHFVSP
jgi:hypothetical protein